MTDKPLIKQPEQINEDILRTYRSSLIISNPGIDPNVQPGSDIYNLSLGVSNELTVALSNLINSVNNLSIETSVGEQLDFLLSIYGLTRIPASYSYGYGMTESKVNILIPIGSQLIDQNGFLYEVTSVISVQGGVNKFFNNLTIQSLTTGKSIFTTKVQLLKWIDNISGIDNTIEIIFDYFGSNLELDSDARARLLNVLQNPLQFGNWSDISNVFNDFTPSIIEKAFIYSCANGPGTQHIALTAKSDGYTGYADSKKITDQYLEKIRSFAVGRIPSHTNTVITSVNPIQFDMIIALSLPYPVGNQKNGIGGGWVNFTPWPQVITIQSHPPDSVSSMRFTVQASAPLPQIGVSQVSYIDYNNLTDDNKDSFPIRTLLITGYDVVSPTNLRLYFDQPISTTVGYLSPACVNFAEYMSTIYNYFKLMGPGQKTDIASILSRANRQPLTSIGFPDAVDGRLLKTLSTNFTEILDTTFVLRTSVGSPPIPVNINNAPNIWKPGTIGILPIELYA